MIVNVGSMTVTASTFTDNQTSGHEGGTILNAVTLELTNSILVGNRSRGDFPDICAYSGNISGSLNLSSFEDWSDGGNNILWNCLTPFVNPERGDFTPADGSQTVDAGSNDLTVTETDLVGYHRIDNEIVDIGSYEYIHFEKTHLNVPSITTGKNRFLCLSRWESA